MPRILLLLPPSRSHYVVPPVGLGYLAAALKRRNFNDVSVLDGDKEQLTAAKLEEKLREYRPDLVGIQIFSALFNTARKIIKLVNQVTPQATVVIGGPHVTATADTVLDDFPQVNYGFCGEAEPGLPLLVDKIYMSSGIDLGEIPGLIYRADGRTRLNERALVQNLDDLNFPAWECMPPHTYPDSPQGAFYRRFPIAPILTSRGCPFNCTFCGSPVNMTRHHRERSIPRVLDEIEMLYKIYGVREIHIIDDMFSLHKQRVLDFCDGLEQRGLDISYTFPNGLHLSTLDREILGRMKQTGAYAFTVGIESGSPKILQAMRKGLTLDLIREKVNLIRDSGLEPSGFFIIGFPGETREDIEATINFAKSLPLKRAHFSNYLPLPGTESTRELQRRGELHLESWDQLAYYEVPYSPAGITKEELKQLQRKAFLSFHLRPHILWRMMREIRSLNHLKSIGVRALDYLFHRKNESLFS